MADFAVHDFFHRKERKVRKDSLNGFVLNYNPVFVENMIDLSLLNHTLNFFSMNSIKIVALSY